MVNCYFCKMYIPLGYKIFMGMDHAFCSKDCRSLSVFFKCNLCKTDFHTFQLSNNICINCINKIKKLKN